MKISRQQKELNRQALLSAAVDIMSEEGIKNATMRRIAQQAGLSEPVIYKYFPTKEHLLVAYFGDSLKTAIGRIESLPDFATLGFAEQIQLLFDAQMAEFERHREFVHQAFRQLFLTTLSGSLTYLAEQRQAHIEYMTRLLDAAVAAEEFPDPPGRQLIAELLWDFHVGMTFYWLNDTSPGSARTLQMLDKSLALFTQLLRSDLLSRAMDLIYFLAREHFIKAVDSLTSLSDAQKERKARFLKNEEGKKDPSSSI
ncbi:MAG: TetR/AcrR family transcriptional regulator [Bdellovibrionales bacterium]|nr:TetR/AcrR family transcriptional regulator [Bdellovibrionales bacterium]